MVGRRYSQPYFFRCKSSADAVELARKAAREAGEVVLDVARVVYVERPTGWTVTLVLR